MDENLKYIFANINDWLKFAEAKCAGILALNIAALIGVLQAQPIFTKDIQDGQGLLLIIFSLSSIITLYSLIPKLNTLVKFYKVLSDLDAEIARRQQNNKPPLNCIYFGDIACLTDAMFSMLATSKTIDENEPLDRLLIHQIVINAKIAMQKYYIFSVASWVTCLGYLFGIVLILFHHF
ncbi:hypothetical protein ACFJIV_12610 [Mucilaginibacter sp. UC70_90]